MANQGYAPGMKGNPVKHTAVVTEFSSMAHTIN
jgi:hypothetical protein